MRVAVIGGRLQGIEAVYLSKKAGWKVDLVDKDSDVPAAGLCDHLHTFDIMDSHKLVSLFKQVDFVIPALENKAALSNIYKCAIEANVKFVYDPQAYMLSASKIKSDKLFAGLGIPAPKPWPLCSFPVTVKPSGASGSENVYKVKDLQEYNKLKNSLNSFNDWVIQEFLDGPSYSIEVIGCNGKYYALQITEIEIDDRYDCKRVLAPVELPRDMVKQFEECAVRIAEALKLDGIMDVEAILHDGELKVLEIDARLPSQTPTAVYKSTGINMLQLLWSGCDKEILRNSLRSEVNRGVVYEHIEVAGKQISVCGEHIIANAGHLYIYADFFGADEAITNFREGREEWVATLIITGMDRSSAWEKRCKVIDKIIEQLNIDQYIDLVPEL